MTTLSRLPVEITQGTTLSWESYSAEYPNTSYSLSTTLFSSRHNLSVTASNSGASWLSTLTATQTSAMAPGLYGWQSFAICGAERYLVDSGTLEVLADSQATQLPPLDGRSTSRKMYEDLSTMLVDASFVKALSPDQLLALAELRKNLEWDVKRERDAAKLAAGGYPTRKVFTRFTKQ